MENALRANDTCSELAVYGLSLFECCSCHNSKHDPVQLNCLHYYCRSCFDSSGCRTHALGSTFVTCPACSGVTDISTVLTNSFLSTYKRASAIRAEIAWCNTCEKNAKEETAEFWCVVCAEALCYVCYVRHNKFISGHRILEREHAHTLPLSKLIRAFECNLHKEPMEAHCFTCFVPKCRECLDLCSAGSHDFHLLSDEVAQKHMLGLTNRVGGSAKLLDSLLPGVLQKSRAIVHRLQADRTNGHKLLVKHRRRLHDAIFWAFDESALKGCLGMHKTRSEPPDILRRGVHRSCAANIEALSIISVRSQLLPAVRNLLKTMAVCCSLSGRSSISKLRQICQESGSMSIHGSMPLTNDIVLSACLGATVRRQAAPRAPLLFPKAYVSFETTVACWDVAASRHGHVLLAAAWHGLLVYSDRGQQLSSWRPEKRSDGEDDEVRCVAALSEGAAAVGVHYAQLIVLLKLSETCETWKEDRGVALLQSPPWRLAAHGDILAAAEYSHDEQQQLWVWGSVVKLLRLSSGQVLYTQSREYVIASVALTALCVVTRSYGPVKLGSGEMRWVLDAFSHSGQFLWRYETSSEELLQGLCVSVDCWSEVYVTVMRRDLSSGRVLAIGGADGRDCREVMSSERHGLQFPRYLSLARGQERTVLAVLSWDRAEMQARSVSLYEAMG